MSKLAIIHNGEAVTTTLTIAKGVGVQHKNVLSQVRQYQADLEQFGGVAFETRPFATAGGPQMREFALLNERQATLLISYMRNSEIVRQFKIALVREFYELAEQVAGGSDLKSDPLERGEHMLSVVTRASRHAIDMATMFGFVGNQAYLSADRAVRESTGHSPLALLGQTALVAADGEALLTAKDISLRLGIGKLEANPLLIDCGLQTAHRDHKDRLYYELTDAGRQYGVAMDTGKKHSNGTPVRQIKWKASVLPLLTARLQVESEEG